MLFAASCGEMVVYHPGSFDQVYQRPALFLDSSRVAPVPVALHREFIAQLERRLQASPLLGGLVTRAQVLDRLRGQAKMRQAYRVYSETLSVLGMPDRENSVRLADSQKIELLIMAQLHHLPCQHCDPPTNELTATGAVVEARSGTLLWRLHATADVDEDAPDEFAAVAEALADDFMTQFEQSFRPKWHRLRFKHLAPAAGA